MRATYAILPALLCYATLASTASAASLQVTPISIDVAAPATATTVNLTNPGNGGLKAQIRVYRWSMVDGQEHLEPATDVVASPPMAVLKPNTEYTVRIIRTSKQPVTTEETYRLLVDEIPDKSALVKNSVNMAFRYSIPVFFAPAGGSHADLKWTVEQKNGKTYVSATNTGSRRVRLSDLSVGNASGKKALIAKGLAGYVLAHTSKSWVAPNGWKAAADAPLVVTALGDQGPINARAIPAASP